MLASATEIAGEYIPPHRRDRECKYKWFDCWDALVNQALSLCGTPQVKVCVGEVACDPHIHTMFSHCSISTPERILRCAAQRGLGAVAILDHNDIRGCRHTRLCADHLKMIGELPQSFVVIPGVEVSSSRGHVGALFVTEALPTGISPERLIRLIHESGGLAVACHPYHSSGIGDAVFDAPFDAVEIDCGSVFDRALMARNRNLITDPRLAKTAKIGSSDAHYISAIASCYTILNDVQQPTLDSMRSAFESGRSRAVVSNASLRMRKLLSHVPRLK